MSISREEWFQLSALTENIGARIRMYRKLNGCSLADFSKAINKSRSTISKYEHGEITIDIETLCEIAAFFHVPVASLLGEGVCATEEKVSVPAFFDADIYYLYLYNGVRRELQRGVLEVNRDTGSASLYLYFSDFEHYRDCSFLCQGQIHVSTNNISFTLETYSSNDSTVHLCFYHPIRQNETQLIGLVSSQMFPASPMCTKCILSKHQLTESPALIEFLRFSKGEIASIKKDNIVTVSYSIDINNL